MWEHIQHLQKAEREHERERRYATTKNSFFIPPHSMEALSAPPEDSVTPRLQLVFAVNKSPTHSGCRQLSRTDRNLTGKQFRNRTAGAGVEMKSRSFAF